MQSGHFLVCFFVCAALPVLIQRVCWFSYDWILFSHYVKNMPNIINPQLQLLVGIIISKLKRIIIRSNYIAQQKIQKRNRLPFLTVCYDVYLSKLLKLLFLCRRFLKRYQTVFGD